MTAVTPPKEGETLNQITGYGTKRYRTYVLSALTLIYIMNFVDRGLLAVVGPDLVPELGSSDTQFGLLTGFGFALLYTIVGLPLARYADKARLIGIPGQRKTHNCVEQGKTEASKQAELGIGTT